MSGSVPASTSNLLADSVPVGSDEPAYQRVADQLKHMISSGRLRNGERLPPEPDLAAVFSVSRSTIREALRVLSSQRLTVTTRGTTGGTFVSAPQPDDVSEIFELNLNMLSGTNDVTTDELLECRRMLEVPAVGLAAERRTDEDLELILRLALPNADHSAKQDVFHDHQNFHTAVLSAAHNSLLSVMLRPTFAVLEGIVSRLPTLDVVWATDIDRHHLAIYEALAARDVAWAQQEMADHLDELRLAYREQLATAAANAGPATS
jgi:DNA-binding FadR family transcriptional regulator